MATIYIACPAPPRSQQGNRITALRWARILRALGHRVRVGAVDDHVDCDLLVALHARRSARAILDYRAHHPDRPLVLALTGTDLYQDLGTSGPARRSVALADRLVVLQPGGRLALPVAARRKVRVIYQSVQSLGVRRSPPHHRFQVCQLAHLRSVKDPLLVARAVRDLPLASRLRVVHAGRALSDAMAARARAEEHRNPRYRWLGERSHRRALALLGASHVLVLSSRLEGGANVIGEAATLGVAIVATRIDGTVGLLGSGYPGLFPPGDAGALRELLLRAERDPSFYARLRRATQDKAELFDPRRERGAWQRLLSELL